MKILIEKSFDRDVDKIKDKNVLSKLQNVILKIKSVETIGDKDIYRYFPRR